MDFNCGMHDRKPRIPCNLTIAHMAGFAQSGPGRVRVRVSGPVRAGFWAGFCRSPLKELSCMSCVCLMHLWSLMWTPEGTFFSVVYKGPSRESIILLRVEGKDIGKRARQKIAFSIGRLAFFFFKTIDFEVFDRQKLENYGFEKQVPGSIPSGSALMACLVQVLFVMFFLHDRSFCPRNSE